MGTDQILQKDRVPSLRALRVPHWAVCVEVPCQYTVTALPGIMPHHSTSPLFPACLR